MPQTPGNSSDINELQTSAPDNGSKISDMVNIHELGIEVEGLRLKINQYSPVLPESQPPSSQKPNFKRYEKEYTIEPCSPTEDAGKDDASFSGKVEIISKENFVSNIAQKIPRLEKTQKYIKISHYATETISFFNDNIWNLKLMKELAQPPDNLPKSEHTFFKMVQSLLYSSNSIKHFDENGTFEYISLISYNFIAPKPYVAPASNLTNNIGLKQGAAEYLASCLRGSNGYSYPVDDGIKHGTFTYKGKHLWHESQNHELKKNEAIKDRLACHKNLGINQICYGILASFCVAGVDGLMVCSDDWRTSSVKGALSLIEISKRLSEGKHLVEPLCLCTNKYICSLLNKTFFSSESSNPAVTLRFEFSQCLVSDFGDSWVEKRSLRSSDEVTLTVPSSTKLTARIDLF
ncbi:hypothetical protein O181_027332 [Austropuccinia psidii MF-1]|uniref:Uncharacterized protein n=1 Tax=Austropuccinia psidii MF-1 TaxID=1389203 RepID=A0A9Q3H1L3_9BASI|nr:hypothetical protein [Austropuccinia psidii MF-1]